MRGMQPYNNLYGCMFVVCRSFTEEEMGELSDVGPVFMGL